MTNATKLPRTARAAALMIAQAIAVLGLTPVSASALETIQPGSIAIGSDQVFPPYDYLDNGVTKGFDADVMALIAPKLGLETSFQDTRFANLISGLQANRYDLIASALYITPARAAVVDYIPYAKTGGALMVRADDSFAPKEPKDLCGKRVGNLKGAAWVPELQKLSDEACGDAPMSVREFATSAEAAQALLSRGVDVVFDDVGVAQSAVASSGERLKITSDEILFPVVMGLAVKKGNDELKEALSTALNEVIASGEYQTVLDQYKLAMPTDAEVAAALGQGN